MQYANFLQQFGIPQWLHVPGMFSLIIWIRTIATFPVLFVEYVSIFKIARWKQNQTYPRTYIASLYTTKRYYLSPGVDEWMSWLSGAVFIMAGLFSPSVSTALCFQLATSLFVTAVVIDNKRFCNLSSQTKLQNLNTSWIYSKTACNSVPPTCLY